LPIFKRRQGRHVHGAKLTKFLIVSNQLSAPIALAVGRGVRGYALEPLP
jgi:hypothetical protein